MKTKMTEMFGIDVPIFAFSHCRDVVAEVSKAGGMGFLGATYMTPEQLDAEMNWIEDQIGDKPYGVDVVMPNRYQKLRDDKAGPEDLPQEQVEFMRRILDEAGIPRLPERDGDAMLRNQLAKVQMTREQVAKLLDVALEHPIKGVVNALGTPEKALVDRIHAKGMAVGSLVGKVEHALAQKEAGVDFVVAQGMEAGGHTGKVTSMILWPNVIDAIDPIPVLAAGGVGSGRQMAAALALGAAGVWCGSIWLGTRESEVLPEVKERFWESSAEEAIQTKLRSGKSARMLRSGLSDAWERPDAPPFLHMPYQTLVMQEPHMRVERAKAKEFMYYPVGQLVGDMTHETSCKQVIYDMMTEFVEATERMGAILADEG
ncbi:MAG: nitronate monooxygenase [Alphaproteobacteria bacterium]|nr:nitronate monooxygenase [Alphaproteobacteria bacterium]